MTRISELYDIPQWAVNSGTIAICIVLVSFPFVARVLLRPKYYKFKEMILFKVLWRWKYKKDDIVGLWCYCPKCQSMLACDDENCRGAESLKDKMTFFICHECSGGEVGRVTGGDRRYALSLVRRDIWRHIREGRYNEMSRVTKEALNIYATMMNNPSLKPLAYDSSEEILEAQEELSKAQEDVKSEEVAELLEDEKKSVVWRFGVEKPENMPSFIRK